MTDVKAKNWVRLFWVLSKATVQGRVSFFMNNRSPMHNLRQIYFPLLGLSAGFPCQPARQLLCKLGQGYTPSERLIQRILTSSAHVICTMRSKQDYVALGQERQDGSREGGLESRTA